MIRISNVSALFTENQGFNVKKADIFIKEDKIARIIFTDDSCAAKEAEEITRGEEVYEIDGTNKLVIPGLVNSHTHAYMTIFRDMADDVPFTEWLFDTITPLEDAMLPMDAYYGTLLGNMEMIRTGTTSYVDMFINPVYNAKAADESGMRAILTRGLVGDDRHDEGGLRRIAEAMRDIEAYKDNDRIGFMFAPHAPYSCGHDLMRYISDKAKELGIGINVHLSEGTDEIRGIREKYNMTPIEYADTAGLFDVNCIAAHCVYLSDSDFDILRDKKVNVAANPVSNMKLANGFSEVPRMLKHGINVCLGTDGAASNNTLNMFREMTIEALIHKGLMKDAIGVSAEQVLRMATLNGAKAMGLEGVTGQIKEGYKADLAIIDLNRPQLRPANNLEAALVYSCNGSEVETVICDGKILMEKNEMKTIDEERVFFEIAKIGERNNAFIKGGKV